MNCPPPLLDQLTVEQFNRGCEYLDALLESHSRGLAELEALDLE